MHGAQCDTCRKFDNDPSRWIYVQRRLPDGGFSLFGQAPSETVGTFCTMRCLAEFAYVLAVSEDKATEAPKRRRKGEPRGVEDSP